MIIDNKTGISLSLVIILINMVIVPATYFWIRRISNKLDSLDLYKISKSECGIYREVISKDFKAIDQKIENHTDTNTSEHKNMQKALDQMSEDLNQVSHNLELTAGSLVTVSDCLSKIAQGKEC